MRLNVCVCSHEKRNGISDRPPGVLDPREVTTSIRVGDAFADEVGQSKSSGCQGTLNTRDMNARIVSDGARNDTAVVNLNTRDSAAFSMMDDGPVRGGVEAEE